MNEALQRNEACTRQLGDLARLSEPELHVIVHDNWTIAVKLAHVAFWDRFALGVLDRWARREAFRIDVPDWYDDVLNEAVLVESLAVHPAQAARLAVEAASRLDARLRGLDPLEAARLEQDAADPATDANWLLHRHRHRAEHLGEIAAALEAHQPR